MDIQNKRKNRKAERQFSFDPDSHTYRLGDLRLPSVTEIVTGAYGRNHYAGEFYLHQGSMTHKAIALHLQGILDPATVDDRIAGKLEAAERAITELGLDITGALIEKPLYHKLLLFAGTPDLLPTDGRLIDWKSGIDKLTTPPQLGGYYELLIHNGYKVKTLTEVALNANGKPEYQDYEIKKSRRLFMAGLTVFNHKQKEGR